MDAIQEKGTFTQSGLARKLGVTRQAVGNAIKAGRIKLDDNGRIDPDDEINQAFLVFHAGAVKATGQNGRGRPLTTTPAGVNDVSQLVNQGKWYDNKIKAIKLKQARLSYNEQMGIVIPREMVSRVVSMIASLLSENFRSFDDRNADELFELAAQGGDKRSFAAVLSSRINESMGYVTEGIQKALDKLEDEF